MDIVKFAKQLSVSTATVSRALRPETAHLVREPLRKRIQTLADELGYVPNPAARSMRSKKALIISVLAPYNQEIFLGEYHARLMFAILTKAKGIGADVKICTIDNLARDFIENLRNLTFGSGGLIYMGGSLTAANLQAMRQVNRPLVVLKAALPSDISASDVYTTVIGVDNVAGGYLAAKHLLDLGHRRIGFVNADRQHHVDAHERWLGAKKAFAERNLPWDPAFYAECTTDFASAGKAWLELRTARTLTGVICMNDEMARGVIAAARSQGVQCPGDLAVVGFDNSRLAYFVDPGLTSIEQPLNAVGAAMVDEVVRGLREPGRNGGSQKHDLTLEPKLVIRASSGGPLKAG